MSQPSNPKSNPTSDPKNGASTGSNPQNSNVPNLGNVSAKPTNQPALNPAPTAGIPQPQAKPTGNLPNNPSTQTQAGTIQSQNPPPTGVAQKPAGQPGSQNIQSQPLIQNPAQNPSGTVPGKPSAGVQAQTKPTGSQNPQTTTGVTGGNPKQQDTTGASSDLKPVDKDKGKATSNPNKTPAKGKTPLAAHSDGEEVDEEEIDLVEIVGKTVHIKKIYEQRDEHIKTELASKKKKLAGAQAKIKELLEEHKRIAEQPRYVFPTNTNPSSTQKPTTAINPGAATQPGQPASMDPKPPAAANQPGKPSQNVQLAAPANPSNPTGATNASKAHQNPVSNQKLNETTASKLPPLKGAPSKPSTANGLNKSESEAKLTKIYALERVLKEKIKIYQSDIQKLEERLSRNQEAKRTLKEKEKILENNQISDKTIHKHRLLNQQIKVLYEEQKPRKFRRVKKDYTGLLEAILSPDKVNKLKSPKIPPLKFPLDKETKLKESQMIQSILAPKKNNNHLVSKTLIFDPKDPSKHLLTPKKDDKKIAESMLSNLGLFAGTESSGKLDTSQTMNNPGKLDASKFGPNNGAKPNPTAADNGAKGLDKAPANPQDAAQKPPAQNLGAAADKPAVKPQNQPGVGASELAPGKTAQPVQPGQSGQPICQNPGVADKGPSKPNQSGLGSSELAPTKPVQPAQPGQSGQPTGQNTGAADKGPSKPNQAGIGGSELAPTKPTQPTQPAGPAQGASDKGPAKPATQSNLGGSELAPGQQNPGGSDKSGTKPAGQTGAQSGVGAADQPPAKTAPQNQSGTAGGAKPANQSQPTTIGQPATTNPPAAKKP